MCAYLELVSWQFFTGPCCEVCCQLFNKDTKPFWLQLSMLSMEYEWITGSLWEMIIQLMEKAVTYLTLWRNASYEHQFIEMKQPSFWCETYVNWMRRKLQRCPTGHPRITNQHRNCRVIEKDLTLPEKQEATCSRFVCLHICWICPYMLQNYKENYRDKNDKINTRYCTYSTKPQVKKPCIIIIVNSATLRL